MERKSDRLYPSKPIENNGLEQRLEQKLNGVFTFNYSITNIKELITYFKDKNHKSKKRYKNYETLNTILDSVDTVVIIGSTSTSKTLPITGVGLILLPIPTGIACTLSFGIKVLHKIMIDNCNKNKKQSQKDQQTIKYIDKLTEEVYKIL